MTIIARLTIREAVRRRLLAALIILTLLVVALVGWGFQRLAAIALETGSSDAQVKLIVSQLLILVMFMFSFVVGMTAVFATAPAIAGDVESGQMLAIVARPIRRSEVLLGKWLGNLGVLVTYAVAGGGLLLAAVAILTGFVPTSPVAALGYLAAETAVGTTLALLLSTLLPPMAGGAVAVVCFGLAWMGGITGGIGGFLQNDTLVHVGTVSRLLLPTDGLWRGTMFSLEPAALVAAAPSGFTANPFFASAAPPAAYLVWVALWAVALLAAAAWVFRAKEL